jgi:hypothetical protein
MDGKPAIAKHVETWAALITALGSIAVPIMLYVLSTRVADQQQDLARQQHDSDQRNVQRALVISTVGYLADDNPQKRNAGFLVISWLKENAIDVPPPLLEMAAAVSRTEPATAVSPASATVAAAAAGGHVLSARQQYSQTAADALGGLVPRIFVQIAAEDQRPAADMLRLALQQLRGADGRQVIAPGVERVAQPSKEIELRYLKKADAAEAQELVARLGDLLQGGVTAKDLSPTFDGRADIKRRTYELWFPTGPIALK